MNSSILDDLRQCIPEDLLGPLCSFVPTKIDSQVFTAQRPVHPPTHATLITWLFLNISASQALLPILAAGLVFSRPRAEPTLINIIIGWIAYGLVSSIL